MSWTYLGIAVVFEIVVAMAAGRARGFTRLGWTIATLASGALGTYFLSLALRTFDVGVGYAIWTATAGAGITVLGTVLLRQRLGWRKVVGLAVVIAGVIGLQLSGVS